MPKDVICLSVKYTITGTSKNPDKVLEKIEQEIEKLKQQNMYLRKLIRNGDK